MPGASYSVFDHTADIGIEVVAPTPEGIYATAASALFEVLSDVSLVTASTARVLVISADDPADLLVRWLGELLFLHDAEGWIFSEFQITELTERRLKARVGGELYDPGRHRIKTEIKAVTYHQVTVEAAGGGWRARFVLDV